MSFNYQDFVFDDFSGGITDKYISIPGNESKTIDNFNINEKGRLVIRPGFDVFLQPATVGDELPRNKITGIINFNSEIYFIQTDLANNKIRLVDDDQRNTEGRPNTKPEAITSTGGSSENVFVHNEDYSLPSFSEWSSNLIVTNRGDDAHVSGLGYNYPVNVYKDDQTLPLGKFHTFGLPDFDGTVAFSPTGIDNTLPLLYRYIIYYTFEYEVTERSDIGIPLKKTIRYVSKPVVKNYYRAETTPIGTGGSDNDITITIPSKTPGIADGTYDHTTMKVEVFRTQGNIGDAFYKIDDGKLISSALGAGPYTLSFNDNQTDEELFGSVTSFFGDATILFGQPPKCKYLSIVNSTGYYGGCVDKTTGKFNEKLLYQSIPGVPSLVDESAIEVLQDDITGIGEVNGLPVVFTKSYIYRIEGGIDQKGNGTLRLNVISDVIGCVSHNSIVNAGKKLYWAGNNGFYVTDGYNVVLLTARLTESYTKLATDGHGYYIYATYDKLDEVIYFAVKEGFPLLREDFATLELYYEALRAINNDSIWVYNIKTEGFTKITQENFSPTALTERDGKIYRSTEDGYIFIHDDELLDDIEPRNVASNTFPDYLQWFRTHIPFKFLSYATDFGAPAMKKWVNTATITYKSGTKLAMKPTSINDDSFKVADMAPIRQINTDSWANPDFIWNDIRVIWRVKNTISKQRRFPRKHMRCWRKQIGLEPARVVLFSSATVNTAMITDKEANSTIYKVNLLSSSWPVDVEDLKYTIAFGFDEGAYEEEFTIKAYVSTSEIEVQIPSIVPANKNKQLQWRLIGYNKKQKCEIQSISVKFAPISREGDKLEATELSDD